MAQSKAKRTKQDPGMLLDDEELDLICDWEVCKQLFQNMDSFSEHMALQHAGQVDVDDKGSVTCMWEDCEFVTSDQNEMTRHIYYHAYHTKIKCLGANLIEKLGLQSCKRDSKTRNVVPELTEPLICLWVDCQLEFLSVQEFYWHVHTHSSSNDSGGENAKKCLWGNCKKTFQGKFNLRAHLKSHSQEKSIACPTCGAYFADRTSLGDHCLRQLPPDS